MMLEGIINLNKPADMTSHKCVQEVRKITGIKRVGHTGTLDPKATGVLPICVGNAVRVMEYLDLDLKKYRCEMSLGVRTETQDVWGEVLSDVRGELKKNPISREAAIKAFDSQTGLIWQTPPKYSAIKVNGRRLYEYARKGEAVDIKKRQIFIKDISITEINLADHKISFEVTCSKGTYIRSICSDVGENLGCGGAMSSLVRLESGAFTLDGAVSLDDLSRLGEAGIGKVIKPADFALCHFGRAAINSEERVIWFLNGGRIALNEATIEAEPEFASVEPAFAIRDEFRRAYNIYSGVCGKIKVLFNRPFKKCFDNTNCLTYCFTR
jgi:tRNA pseudouridine55 synthase